MLGAVVADLDEQAPDLDVAAFDRIGVSFFLIAAAFDPIGVQLFLTAAALDRIGVPFFLSAAAFDRTTAAFFRDVTVSLRDAGEKPLAVTVRDCPLAIRRHEV